MLGVFLPAFDAKVRLDNDQLGRGDTAGLGNDLRVERTKSAGWLGAEWRFAPRHRLGFTYSRFSLRGEQVLDRQLQIGDEVFPVGASVSSSLSLTIVPVTYSYSFLKRDADELAVLAGLHWSRVSFAATGSVSVAAQDASNDASGKATVPLPLLGLRYDHHFGPRWSVGANAGAFALRLGKDTWGFEGALWNARLHAEYRFARNFAAGAAVEGFKANVDTDYASWKGSFATGYWGPQLYLTARF